jgi:PhnB protein
MVSAIPEGFGPITPHLTVTDAGAAMAFYAKAFGAEEVMRMPGPGGQGIMHAEMQIGGARVMLGSEMPQMEYWLSPTKLRGTTVALHIYCEDVDAVFKNAVDAGASVVYEPMDTFWGDRYGRVRDPFGHEWGVATHIADLTPAQIAEGQAEWMKQMNEGGEDCAEAGA